MKVEDAEKKLCPFSFATSHAPENCLAAECMA